MLLMRTCLARVTKNTHRKLGVPLLKIRFLAFRDLARDIERVAALVECCDFGRVLVCQTPFRWHRAGMIARVGMVRVVYGCIRYWGYG
jgi:hypothetical protein